MLTRSHVEAEKATKLFTDLEKDCPAEYVPYLRTAMSGAVDAAPQGLSEDPTICAKLQPVAVPAPHEPVDVAPVPSPAERVETPVTAAPLVAPPKPVDTAKPSTAKPVVPLLPVRSLKPSTGGGLRGMGKAVRVPQGSTSSAMSTPAARATPALSLSPVQEAEDSTVNTHTNQSQPTVELAAPANPPPPPPAPVVAKKDVSHILSWKPDATRASASTNCSGTTPTDVVTFKKKSAPAAHVHEDDVTPVVTVARPTTKSNHHAPAAAAAAQASDAVDTDVVVVAAKPKRQPAACVPEPAPADDKHAVFVVNGKQYRKLEEVGKGGSSKVYKVR